MITAGTSCVLCEDSGETVKSQNELRRDMSDATRHTDATDERDLHTSLIDVGRSFLYTGCSKRNTGHGEYIY
jgi:hypothetical protein